MSGKRKARAARTGNGFTVYVARTARARDGEYVLHVTDDGRVTGLPGTDDDIVLILLADTEIRAEGWPSVADNMLRRNNVPPL